jgi:hypothetical protein
MMTVVADLLGAVPAGSRRPNAVCARPTVMTLLRMLLNAAGTTNEPECDKETLWAKAAD